MSGKRTTGETRDSQELQHSDTMMVMLESRLNKLRYFFVLQIKNDCFLLFVNYNKLIYNYRKLNNNNNAKSSKFLFSQSLEIGCLNLNNFSVKVNHKFASTRILFRSIPISMNLALT